MLFRKSWEADGSKAPSTSCAVSGVLLLIAATVPLAVDGSATEPLVKINSSRVPDDLGDIVDEATPPCNPAKVNGLASDIAADTGAAVLKKL